MHDFGGFYLDLDNRAIKPLDVWLYIAPALLHHGPYENTFFGYRKTFPLIAMSTMASRPGHPFFQKLMEETNLKCFEVQNQSSIDITGVVKSTGPFYLDSMYHIYMQENLESFAAVDDVQIVHPK